MYRLSQVELRADSSGFITLDIIFFAFRIERKLEVIVNVPKELKYTKEHEWVKVEGDIATLGITDYAQEQLSDIVYLELPSSGTTVEQAKSLGTIEAVKAVTDIYAPLSGEVIETNEEVKNSPGAINEDPYGAGWIVKLKITDLKELDNLLSSEDYEKLLGESH